MIFCFASLLILIGCVNTYKYKDHNYHSQEEALASLKYDLYEVKSQILPTKNKRGGVAAIVIPTFETFIALGVKKRGNPKQELIDYIGKYLVVSNRVVYDFIDQRKIFNKVTLIEDNYPIPVVKKIMAEYDAVIYLDLVSPEQAQWFMRVTPDYKNMPLNSDTSKAVGVSRTLSWLENIENILDESGYKPRR